MLPAEGDRALRHLFTVGFAVVALAIGVAYLVNRPTQFSVAIAGSDGYDQRLFGAASDILRTSRAPSGCRSST